MTKMTNNNERTHSTLKGYIEDFQQNGEEILSELIRHKTVVEENDKVTRLSFADPFLDKLLSDLKFKYYMIDRSDIEAYFMSGLFGDLGEGKGLLYSVDVDKYSASQVCAYVAQKISGHVLNCIKKERLFFVSDNPEDMQVIRDEKPGNPDAGDDETLSHYDDFAYQEWQEVDDYSNAYETFIEYVGGVESVLSTKQANVLHWMKSGLTQQETGDQLGVSQQDIQQTYAAAQKKLRTVYTQYKTYEVIATDKGKAFEILMEFQKNYETVIKFDTLSSDDEAGFDYFGFTVDFLLENKDTKDDVAYEQLHKNKMTTGMSVIDILSDYLTGKNSETFNLVMAGKAHEVTRRQEQDRLVMSVLSGIKKYEKIVAEAIDSISKRMVDAGEGKYDDLGKHLGSN